MYLAARYPGLWFGSQRVLEAMSDNGPVDRTPSVGTSMSTRALVDPDDAGSVVRGWRNEHGVFEVRESLFSGPGGLLKLETRWEVMSDGVRRLTTVIPIGGP